MEILILKTYASIQMLPALLAGRWPVAVAILTLVALFGRRVYCRFLCPLGVAQSLVRAFRGRRRICSRLDAAELRGSAVRTAVRLAILVAAVAAGLAGFGWQWLDPYAIVCRAVCWIRSPEFDWAVAAFALAPVALVLSLAAFAGGRVWCNRICPLGTLLALVGIRPWRGDTMKKCAGCDKCGRCFK